MRILLMFFFLGGGGGRVKQNKKKLNLYGKWLREQCAACTSFSKAH